MMTNKILIADDDPHNLELILEYLADKPNELLYAINGVSAIKLAQKELPDLILMDWEMPILNGIEAVKELQNDPVTKDIPIIIVSGIMLKPSDLKQALDTGAVDFIQKPFDPIIFNARIRANLRIKKQHDTILQLLRKEKEFIQDALHKKERELAATTIFEHEKNNVLSKLIHQLDHLAAKPDLDISNNLGEIKRQLKGHLNIRNSWDNFKLHFEEVHPNFFDRLYEKFGPLSLNEKKMCAYLKIGINNKEIAILTNVVPASVRRSLNRLKKKLRLSPEENLRVYIARF